jgi:hypothetical protein
MTNHDEHDYEYHDRLATVPLSSGCHRPDDFSPSSSFPSAVPSHADAWRTPVELSLLTGTAMPAGVRGALAVVVRGILKATWMPLGSHPVQQGRILLAWMPSDAGRTDVTAYLGLARTEVLLAAWPGLRGEWSAIVRPTVVEVAGLHAALRVATAVLDRLSD